MSSFTIRCDRKTKSSRRAGGRPRRPRPTGQQGYSIDDFLKASNKVTPTKPRVDSDGFTMVPKRNRNRRQSPLSRRPTRQSNANSFAVLATSPPKKKTIAGPAIVKPKSPTGAWATGPKRVKFANDSETLMKPQAAETREYEKGSVPTEFVKMPDEEEYLKLKRNKGAWRPKSIAKAHLEVKATEAEAERADREYTMRLELNARAYEVFNQEPVSSYLGSWADACSDDSDSEDEIDVLGRPTTDNSAW